MSFMRHINLVRKMSFDDAALASTSTRPIQQQQLPLLPHLQQLQPAQQLQLQLQQQQHQHQHPSQQQSQLQLPPSLQDAPFQHQGEQWIPQSMLPVSPAPRHGTGHGNTYVSFLSSY
jgi:hypothetical protein